MSPILETLIAVTVGILLSFLLLSKVSLVVCGNSAHVSDVILVVLGRIFFRILLQDLDDLPTTVLVNAQKS